MTAAMPSITGEGGVTLLLDQFKDFYAKVIDLRELVETRSRTHATATEDGAPPPVDPAAVAAELRAFLESRAFAMARRAGPTAARFYSEAQYVMACLADEVFIHLVAWEGREAWRHNPIEAQLFDTRHGGDRVFENIDNLLAGNDQAQAELASVYLWTLGLGFRGRYRDRDDQGRIAHDRQRLYALVYRRPAELQATRPPLLPEPYAYTLDRGGGGRLRSLARWFRIWVGTVALIIALSVVVWWAVAWPMTGEMNDTRQGTEPTASG